MESNYRIGEYITDFVSIYEITSIGTEKENRLIHYRPIKGTDKVFIASIPEKNLEKASLRKLLTKKEIKVLLDKLKTPLDDYVFDARQIKEDIYSNNPEKLIDYLKYFYRKEEELIKLENDLKEEILNHLCMEISFVTDKNNSSIKKMIESDLVGKKA
ncbi:MAG: hypothetical protein PHX34_05635 [Candidatus Shapirobacteria bacterium]|nr:hypothetical protein [Candidatus Shapirobacteria bacterium]